MMRRPLLLAALSILTLSVAACSDVTGPTTPPEPQVTTVTTPVAGATTGGYGTSTGKR